jgi:serine protease inhibitor
MSLFQATILALFLILGADSNSTVQEKEKITKSNDSSMEFTTGLYSALGISFKDNAAFSPFSIREALGVVALGTNGETFDEMEKSLRFESLITEIPDILKLYGLEKTNSEETSELTIPVKRKTDIFVKKGMKLAEQFLDIIRQFPDIQVASFTDKQKDLPFDVSDSESVIYNILEFSGQWVNPFSTLKPLPFHSNNQETVQTMFMTETFSIPYTDIEAGYYGFSLPFCKNNSSNLSMFFIVPKELDGFEKLQKELFSDGKLKIYLNAIQSADAGKIRLFLPKFTIDNSFLLKPALNTLGIKKAFETNADFSKMAVESKLHIKEVFHKAHVDIDENGANASAETAVFHGSIGLSKKPLTVQVDRPFVYLVYDETNKQVLFMGQCVNPVDGETLVPASEDNPKMTETL